MIIGAMLKQLYRDKIAFPLSVLTAPLLVWAFWLMSANAALFERSLPRVLVFALLLQLFSSGIFVSRSVERGTFGLLRSLGLPTWRYVAGVVGVHVLTGILSFAAAIGMAVILGAESQPEWGLTILTVTVGIVAHVGLGVAIGFGAGDAFRTFAIASVTMFLLMVFAGVILPAPGWDLLLINPTYTSAELLDAAFEKTNAKTITLVSLGLVAIATLLLSTLAGSRR